MHLFSENMTTNILLAVAVSLVFMKSDIKDRNDRELLSCDHK